AGAQGTAFKSMQNPRDPNAAVQVASNTKIGDPLGFKISGTGLLADAEGAGEADGGPQGTVARPGGGLGPPIDTPRPLQKWTPWILGAFGVVMILGAIVTVLRPGMVGGKAPQSASKASGTILDVLKEELFQLEMEHKQGGISQEEYAKAKSALDQTLERALKRKPTA
ncbi:MAG TPA: hypothetical protein VLK33_21220, partial [Terriglobales bacterium]|nr:hypothetical protein [Terriglobales bacterium]